MDTDPQDNHLQYEGSVHKTSVYMRSELSSCRISVRLATHRYNNGERQSPSYTSPTGGSRDSNQYQSCPLRSYSLSMKASAIAPHCCGRSRNKGALVRPPSCASTYTPGARRPGRRRQGDDTADAPADRRRFSPRQTHWLLLRPLDDLDVNERAFREALCQESVTIATAQRPVADFGRIVRARAVTELDAWLAEAKHSRIP